MYLLTGKEALEIDRIAQQQFGILGIVLMENAGSETARWIKKHYSDKTNVAIFAGGGNNGGDGYVVARHLFNAGYDVTLYLAVDPQKISGDAAINLNIAKNISIPVILIEEKSDFNGIDLVVDALFGVGLSREITGKYKIIIDHINKLNKDVVAIDIPSGIDATTGEKMGVAVKATTTITYGYHKRGHFLQDGIKHCGDINCFDISFPKNIVNQQYPKIITEDVIRDLFPKRYKKSHKYSYGHLLIIADGGAAQLCGYGALKSGCGVVTATTQSQPIYLAPELIHQSIDQLDIDQLLNQKSAVVFGPGVGVTEKNSVKLLRLIESKIPLVIDADGLTLIGTNQEIFSHITQPIIITPHPKEMGRLLGISTQMVEKNRFQYAQQYATTYNIIVVLKGTHTIIATPKGKIYLNIMGNHGMATAGSGDLLAGMIGAFLARGIDPESAALIGVYCHSKAGDFAAEKYGYNGLVVSDIIEKLPEVLRNFE